MNPPPVGLSRRRFLQLAATASAAAGLPRTARAATSEIYDDGNLEVPPGVTGELERVVVIGAGFSGLSTANALANAGVEVLVLDGRERLGGRTWTSEVGGVPVDLGGSWIHEPTGNPMTRFAEQLSVARIPAEITDDIATFQAFEPGVGFLSVSDIVVAFLQTQSFDGAASALLAALGPRATIEDGIRRYIDTSSLTPDWKRYSEFAIRFVNEQAESGAANDAGLATHVSNPYRAYGDTGDVFPEGGYVQLISGLASGVEVRLGHRVTRISYDDKGVVVDAQVTSARHGQGRLQRFRASHAVVAVPLGVLKAGAIRFAPFLPIPKARSIQRLGFGFFEKVALRFPEPFWQEGGSTHLLYASTQTSMEFPLFLDLQRLIGEPLLVNLCSGTFARSLAGQSRETIRRRVLAILREIYGAIPEPTDVAVTGWTRDPFSRGAYSFFPVGAVPADMDVLAAPVGGRLLFAGEATLPRRYGTADGAMTSGIREAKRLLGQPTVLLGPLGATAGRRSASSPTAILAALADWRERTGGTDVGQRDRVQAPPLS